MRTIHRILVPLEIGEGAEALAEAAGQLAGKLGAAVDLLFVWNPPALLDPDQVVLAPRGEGPPVSLADLARTEAAGRLHALAEAMRKGGIQTVHSHVGVGEPAHEILGLAEKLGVDLIVMGTHGRRGWSRMWFGSVAEKVVRKARCPVFTLHLPDEAEAAEAD